MCELHQTGLGHVSGGRGRDQQPGFHLPAAPCCVSLETPLQSTRDWKVKMLKFKAFCLDYWQFLCLQPLHGAYKR